MEKDVILERAQGGSELTRCSIVVSGGNWNLPLKSQYRIVICSSVTNTTTRRIITIIIHYAPLLAIMMPFLFTEQFHLEEVVT